MASTGKGGHADTVRALLAAPAQVRPKPPRGVPTGDLDPLFQAAFTARPNLAACAVLVEAGALVDGVGSWNPLGAAAERSNLAVVELLLSAGANVHGSSAGASAPGLAARVGMRFVTRRTMLLMHAARPFTRPQPLEPAEPAESPVCAVGSRGKCRPAARIHAPRLVPQSTQRRCRAVPGVGRLLCAYPRRRQAAGSASHR